jgi:hypothetical protein
VARDRRSAEVEANYAKFAKLLPKLLESRAGKFAVMRAGEIVDFFDTIGDAARFGSHEYKDRVFSIQEVTDRALCIGYQSNAISDPSLRPNGRSGPKR